MKNSANFLLILLISTCCAAQQPLKFTQIINTPDQAVGAQILQVAYAKLHIQIEIIEMSGKRALIESNLGRVDGEVHRIIEVGQLFPQLIRVPTQINYVEPTVFSKNTAFKLAGCKSLKEQIVGRVRGIQYAEICTKGFENVAVLPDSTLLLKALHKDVVDFAITGHFNGLVWLKKHNYKNIIPLGPALKQLALYHYIHHNHKDLVPKIDAVFKAMKASGELKELRQQYMMKILNNT